MTYYQPIKLFCESVSDVWAENWDSELKESSINTTFHSMLFNFN